MSAVIGVLSAAAAYSRDSFFYLQTESPRKSIAALTSRSDNRADGENKAPVMLTPAHWEEQEPIQSSVRLLGWKGAAENIILLQDAGPAPSPRLAEIPQSDKETTRVNPFTGMGNVASDNYKPLSGRQRRDFYLNQNFLSMGAYFGPILSSMIDQANGQPPEWGGGMKGYGRRAASRLGTGMIQGTAQSAACALLGEDPRYIRSSSSRILNRIGHAFLFSLITYNNEGKKRISFGTLASYYAGAIATDMWLPGRYTALGDGVRDGNRQVILASLMNQFQEFFPDLKRLIRRH